MSFRNQSALPLPKKYYTTGTPAGRSTRHLKQSNNYSKVALVQPRKIMDKLIWIPITTSNGPSVEEAMNALPAEVRL